jgi:hypothetical protein
MSLRGAMLVHDEGEITHSLGVSTLPTYVQLIQKQLSTEEEFMSWVQTWPLRRVNMLEQARAYIEETVRRRGDALVVRDLVVPRGERAEGAFGAVVVGCIRDSEADMETYDDAEACHQFSFSTSRTRKAETTSERHPIFVAVKVFKETQASDGYITDASGAVLGHTYSNFNADREYIGNVNPVREAVVGRMLNLLVRKDITPHFPLIYEYIKLPASHQRGTVTELAHMDLFDFASGLTTMTGGARQRVAILQTVVLQVLQGLIAAETHFNFRHMDLHTGNIMMSYATNADYVYKVDAEVFTVPNYGMCWKLIDFGMATSTVLFGDGDAMEMLSSIPAMEHIFQDIGTKRHGVAHVINGTKDMDNYAYETVDFVRFVSTLWMALPSELVTERAFCMYVMSVTAAARDTSRFSIADVNDQSMNDLSMDDLSSTSHGHKMALRHIFHELGQGYVDARHKSHGVVFDVDAKLLSPGDSLTSLEGEFYTVNRDGKLVRKGSQGPVTSRDARETRKGHTLHATRHHHVAHTPTLPKSRGRSIHHDRDDHDDDDDDHDHDHDRQYLAAHDFVHPLMRPKSLGDGLGSGSGSGSISVRTRRSKSSVSGRGDSSFSAKTSVGSAGGRRQRRRYMS